jgi:hypothetical protein
LHVFEFSHGLGREGFQVVGPSAVLPLAPLVVASFDLPQQRLDHLLVEHLLARPLLVKGGGRRRPYLLEGFFVRDPARRVAARPGVGLGEFVVPRERVDEVGPGLGVGIVVGGSVGAVEQDNVSFGAGEVVLACFDNVCLSRVRILPQKMSSTLPGTVPQ